MSRRTRLAIALAAAAVLLAFVVVPVAVQAGGGCHAADGSVHMEATGTTVIRMDVCSFAPTVSTVPVGTTVRFLNTATNDHSVIGRSGTWASHVLSAGDEFSARFDAVGTYPYACSLHPGMVGAIVVTDGPADQADLTTAIQPTEPPPAAPDPIPLVLAALAGVAIGLGLGAVMTRMRARTTNRA